MAKKKHIPFEKRIHKLPKQLEKLINCRSCNRNEIDIAPECGVYLFIDKGRNLYVGKTNRMKARLQEHGRPCAGHNDANFAFLIAYKAAKRKHVNVDMKNRTMLENSKEFNPYFMRAKDRVAAMKMKFVKVDHPIDQYLLEVYAALKLKTPYNNFDNH